MKLTLIIKQSINGCLAKNQTDDLSWGSPEDLKFFTSFTKDAYAMIMGSRTFLAMPEGAFGQRLSIVMTGQKSGHMGRLQQINKKLESKFESKKTTHNKATEIVILGRDPLKVIEFLKNRGLQKAALIGGGVVNSAFLNLGLIEEMYITFCPYIFGTGIPSFSQKHLKTDIEFEISQISKISKNQILVKYTKK